MLSPVFSVLWAGFAAGCIASMIVVVELNDPFSKEVVDNVVKEHATLFWGIMGAGVIVGAGGRIWTLSRTGQFSVVDKANEGNVPVGEIESFDLTKMGTDETAEAVRRDSAVPR